MSQPDNKSLDVQRIRAFIEARGGSEVPVEDIMEHSGAERLRVYPILFEMEQEGICISEPVLDEIGEVTGQCMEAYAQKD